MGAEHAAAQGVRRLQVGLSLAWTAAWVVGIGIFLGVAIRLSHSLHQQGLDAELAQLATAVYGLTWFDEEGFHT